VRYWTGSRKAAFPATHAPGVRQARGCRATAQPKETTMSEHVYKQIELTGSSTQSIQHAIENAIEKASKTLRNLHWFEVTETRGHIENGKVVHWQVSMKVGLRIED
jgi:dodecin